MHRIYYLVIVLFIIQVNLRDSAILGSAQQVLGDEYKCAQMVSVVNQLRALGKERALAATREYLEQGGDHDKVLVICRLLFVNPKGWRPPILGEVVPEIDRNTIKDFPLFPLAIQNNVPFLLVQGYSGGGRGESGLDCIKLCQALELVKSNYSEKGFDNAAAALTGSKSFVRLYRKEDLQSMIEMIVNQSELGKIRK